MCGRGGGTHARQDANTALFLLHHLKKTQEIRVYKRTFDQFEVFSNVSFATFQSIVSHIGHISLRLVLFVCVLQECEEGGDSSLKRSVRDSGYDCWDSERSDSLSPPRHTRDNSLDR